MPPKSPVFFFLIFPLEEEFLVHPGLPPLLLAGGSFFGPYLVFLHPRERDLPTSVPTMPPILPVQLEICLSICIPAQLRSVSFCFLSLAWVIPPWFFYCSAVSWVWCFVARCVEAFYGW